MEQGSGLAAQVRLQLVQEQGGGSVELCRPGGVLAADDCNGCPAKLRTSIACDVSGHAGAGGADPEERCTFSPAINPASERLLEDSATVPSGGWPLGS